MKKILITLLALCMAMCCTACDEEPQPTTLNASNILDYVFVDISFGEVNVHENESFGEKYYLTCLATITVKPKRDYDFADAYVSYALNEGGEWTPVKTKKQKITASDMLYKWSGKIQLDKEGYGERTVALYCYSSTYDKMHPEFEQWDCSVTGSSGTVTENSYSK